MYGFLRIVTQMVYMRSVCIVTHGSIVAATAFFDRKLLDRDFEEPQCAHHGRLTFPRRGSIMVTSYAILYDERTQPHRISTAD
jgi:hypothetical protein